MMNSLVFSDVDFSTSFDDSMCGIGNEFMNSMFSMRDALSALPLCDDPLSSPDGGVKLEGHQVSNSSLSCFTSQLIETTLKASTSSATRCNEPTLTYLNQGQPYELVFQPISDTITSVKSVVRVRFHEHRMEVKEREHLEAWRFVHSGERLLDVDMDRSQGFGEIRPDGTSPNALVCRWQADGCDADRVKGVHGKSVVIAVRLNCIGTEFTVKKHGGEKGVSFRLQVDHFDGISGRALESCACQVKVFKMKGADRKHRTDREKIERKSRDARTVYQAAQPVTLLTRLTGGSRAGSLVSPGSGTPTGSGLHLSEATASAADMPIETETGSPHQHHDEPVVSAEAAETASPLTESALLRMPASITPGDACFRRVLVPGVQNSLQVQTPLQTACSSGKPVGLSRPSPIVSIGETGGDTVFSGTTNTNQPGMQASGNPVPSVSSGSRSCTSSTNGNPLTSPFQSVATSSRAGCEAGVSPACSILSGVQRRRRLCTSGGLDYHCLGCCSTCGRSCFSHSLTCTDEGPCAWGLTGQTAAVVGRGAKFRPCWLPSLGSATTPSSSNGGGGGGRILSWDCGPIGNGGGAGRHSARLSATWMSEKRRASCSNGYEQLRRDVSGLSVGGIRRQPKGGLPQSVTTGVQRLRHHHHHHHHNHPNHSHYNFVPTSSVGATGAQELSTSAESNLCGDEAPQQQSTNWPASCRCQPGKALDSDVRFGVFSAASPQPPQDDFPPAPGNVGPPEEHPINRDGGYSSGDVTQQQQHQPIVVCESVEIAGEGEATGDSREPRHSLDDGEDADEEDGDGEDGDEEDGDGDDEGGGDDEDDGDDDEVEDGGQCHIESPPSATGREPMGWASVASEETAIGNNQFGVGMNPEEVTAWLRRENFSHLVDRFLHFTGRDMLRLTREDYTSLCGNLEGLRLYNAIYHRPTRPRCTLYIGYGATGVYHAVMLHQVTRCELLLRLANLLGRHPEQVEMLCLLNEEHGIPVLITDQLLAHLEDQSCYELVALPGSPESTNLFLKPV